jgi:hypothetical protein
VNKFCCLHIVSDLFWKAPELLREPNITPCGSQKADVYAFAIILYEIIGRKGPFGVTHYEPKGTLSKPTNGNLVRGTHFKFGLTILSTVFVAPLLHKVTATGHGHFSSAFHFTFLLWSHYHTSGFHSYLNVISDGFFCICIDCLLVVEINEWENE